MRQSLVPFLAFVLLLLLAGAVAAETSTVVLAVEGMTCGS